MPLTAKAYHHITSYHRAAMKSHTIDWTNQPCVHKMYPGLEYRHLPRPEIFPRGSLRNAATAFDERVPPSGPAIDRLSVILALAYGITGRVQSGGNEFYYRSAPSAGALYPVEIYLAAGEIAGLPSGLYHYDVARFGLCTLRSGKVMPWADRCIGLDRTAAPADVSFFLSSITFRSAWKYKERAFRYILQDTGYVLENLLMALKAEGLSAAVHYDIDKESADRLFGLDPKRETCFACVRIAGSGLPTADSSDLPAPLSKSVLDAGKVSRKENFFDEIEQISLAASRPTVPVAPSPPMFTCIGISPRSWQPVRPATPPVAFDFFNTVIHRRSRRNFIPKTLAADIFFGLLDILTLGSKRRQPSAPPYSGGLTTGLLVQNVEGVESGFYLCDFEHSRWGMVRPGSFNASMAAACLDQMWLQNAAVHVCFITNLDQLDRTWGARGYQYAMLDAGRIGETVYLGATALGIGCCAIGALYDNEAKELLGLNESSALLSLVAAGPVRPPDV